MKPNIKLNYNGFVLEFNPKFNFWQSEYEGSFSRVTFSAEQELLADGAEYVTQDGLPMNLIKAPYEYEWYDGVTDSWQPCTHNSDICRPLYLLRLREEPNV